MNATSYTGIADSIYLTHCDTTALNGVLVFLYRGYTVARDAIEHGAVYHAEIAGRRKPFATLEAACLYIDGRESILSQVRAIGGAI